MSNKSTVELGIEESKKLRPGSEHYRAYVGPPAHYDYMGATQFSLLFMLGIREEHHVLDLGCGSLRAGRFLIQYLLPNRYFGVEPNDWLWKKAIETEIGQDIIKIKKPKFSKTPSFDIENLSKGRFNFIIAQSIFSHTGNDLFKQALEQSAKSLKPNGQFIFTVLDEKTKAYGNRMRGDQEKGWIYPECVTFEQAQVAELCASFGIHVQRLNWFHPRQSWYRGVLNRRRLLSDNDLNNMGTGKPVLDNRFPTHP